jgi:hypothetical protein
VVLASQISDKQLLGNPINDLTTSNQRLDVYFQMLLLAERFIFGERRLYFSERGNQDLSNGTHVAS